MLNIITPRYEIIDPPEYIEGIPAALELAGRTCYKSEDRITATSCDKFVRMVCRRGHESVLEHKSISVRVVCSRACSHQLVRHRLAAYCLSGDTVVPSIGKRKWSLRDLYGYFIDPNRNHAFQSIRLRSIDNNNKMVPGQIASVTYSGKKQVLRVRTQFGRVIKASKDHLFMTTTGWKRLENLKPLDRVVVSGKVSVDNKGWLIDHFLAQNKSEKEISFLLGANDQLAKMKDAFTDKIIAIDDAGVEDTYDIEMWGPHNFVANGFVVHNSQESQRYVNYNKKGFEVICPPSIGLSPGSYRPDAQGWYLIDKPCVPVVGQQLRWLTAIYKAFQAYSYDVGLGVKPEDARYYLPNATKTELVVTMNLRQWRHVFKMRALNPHAQWEIRGIMLGLYEELEKSLPCVFSDLTDQD